eukprot:12361463-Alexandrium_andersonii.AAC.1
MFPAFARFSFHGATCSFTYSREEFGLPARHRGVILEQTGNSMNVNMMGVAWLHWLVSSVGSRKR